MFVHSLEIKDLRSFEYLKMSFSKNINIITGPNNSGKSTIIKSLYKLQDFRTLGRSDIRTNKNSCHILTEILDVAENEKQSFKNGKGILLPKETKANIILESFTTSADKNSIEQDSLGNVEVNLNNVFANQSTGNVSFIEFLGFPSSEEKNNFIYPFFSKRKTSHYGSQIGKENTYSVLDNFQNLPAKVIKTSSQPITKKEFDRLCENILGFTVGIFPGEGTEFKIGFSPGYNTTIPLESMGEGVANIVGLITILLTEDRKLFLIEELENDIHPTALKKLLNLIIEKSETNQFIISTHSNIILKNLGSLPSSKIFYTEIEQSKTGNLSIPTSTISEIQNSPQERLKVLEFLGYDLFDYDFYNSYLILEESSAEKVIRDFIIPNYFPELKFKLRTIAAQGASDIEPKFNDLHRLFMYLHTTEVYKNKAWVIADGDEAGEEAITKLKKKFTSWDNSYFKNFEKPYFELYYPSRYQNKVKTIMAIENPKERQKEKTTLLNNVVNWYEQNLEDAKKEFSESAKDVIEKINAISQKIK